MSEALLPIGDKLLHPDETEYPSELGGKMIFFANLKLTLSDTQSNQSTTTMQLLLWIIKQRKVATRTVL
jgi:hypothetical protein